MSKSDLRNITILLMLLLPAFSFAQGVTNNGAAIIINGTSTTTSNVYININGATGNYLSDGTGVINCTNVGYDINADGSGTSSITIGGNWTNNGSTTGITGKGLTAIFNNATATQTIGGTSSTTFFNLICQGLGKTFNASSSPFAVQVNQNFSVSSAVNYSNISSILVGKLFMGSSSINSASLPVTIGDDYLNTATGYSVTGDWTYNGSAPGGVSQLIIGALNYKNLNVLSYDGNGKAAPVYGATTVSSNLTVTDKCTMQANGNLTLLSTANGTASIAALTGSANITGNVNVQRFVTGSYGRSYRLISSPINTATGFYTIASLLNNTPITGPNSGAGSFDPSNTNNASIWMYREGDPFPANTVIKDSDYKGIYSLTENIPVGTGLLFFNRGSRSSLTTKLRGPVFPTPDNNAIVFIGVPNQGSISVKVPQNNINNFTVNSPFAKESPGSSVQSAYYYKYNSSYAPVANLPRTNWFGTSGKSGDQSSDGFNLIGNPYASTIDLDLVTFGTDINPFVYVYNPINKQFSYYSKGSATSGSAVTDGNGANRYIASGQGFFARCNVVGSTNAGITFNEPNKVSNALTSATSPVLLMSAKNNGELGTGSYLMGAPVGNTLNPVIGVNSSMMVQLKTDSINYDGIGLFFNKGWAANYDVNDASDPDGISPTVYLSSYSTDNARLAINKMPTITKQTRVKLYVDATTTANQQLSITDMSNIAPKFNVYVVDHYKKDSLQLTQNNSYNFNIDRADTASKGANRLELVFKLNPVGAYKLLDFGGKLNGRNVVLNWTTRNEASYTSFIIEKSVDDGKTFTPVGTVAANSIGVYTFTDSNVENGNPIYRLKQIIYDEISYSDQVQIKLNTVNIASFYIYPNPASTYILINTGKVLNEKCEVKITNMAGIMALKSTANSNNLRMEIASLLPGIYIVEVVDAAQKVIGRTKFIKN